MPSLEFSPIETQNSGKKTRMADEGAHCVVGEHRRFDDLPL
jgi:hypothetical protein